MNQHDETRKMLELIREEKRSIGNTNKIIITEQITTGGEAKPLDTSELKLQEKSFRDAITPRVKFNKFTLYPKAQNVEWSGEFIDSRIEWYYSLDETVGVYMSSDLLQLSDDILKQIQRLAAYYKTWAEDWATRIAEEYQNQVVDNENQVDGPDNLDDSYFGEEGEGESMPQPPVENA